jgi:hypothetical protein
VRLKTNECSFDLARDFSAMLNVTSMLHTLFLKVGEINVNLPWAIPVQYSPKRITKSRELVTFFSKYADMNSPEWIHKTNNLDDR